MTEQPRDDHPKAQQIPSYDELVEMKARGQQKMVELRLEWRSRYAAMTTFERTNAYVRFGRAAKKISSQFGKSRRLTINLDAELDK